MTHKQPLLFLVGSLALTLCAVAQDNRKVAPLPLPQHDLDGKFAPAASVTPTSPKTDVLSVHPVNQQPEPTKGVDSVVLPNGKKFRLGLPTDQVIYDDSGDQIWVEGVGYKARFNRQGLTFVPFFGSNAPKNYPLALTLENARLGATVSPVAIASPHRQGDTITMDRGGVQERYDLTTHQVEQKFVINSPFVGELVLTLGVSTELQAEPNAEGIRFSNSLGQVGYSNAVLVDARGHRTAMQTEYANGSITLRATAAAIANAAFPVTVDPVVVNFVAATSTVYVLTEPDIAFSAISNNYLVVWTRQFTAFDWDLHSVAVDTSGNIVAGSSTLLDNTIDRWEGGRVASSGNNFLGVASRTPTGGGQAEIWGRTRDVSSTTTNAQFQISESTFTGDKVSPDVGGEFDGPVNFGVVWQRNFTATDHDIHYRLVATSTGAPSGATRIIDNSGANDDFRPRMSKSDGRLPAGDQIWVVCWQRLIGGTQHDIYGARVQWNGTLLTAPFAIDTAATDNDRRPSPTSLTGDIGGSKYWLVAYDTDNTGNLDIYMRAFRDGATPVNVSSSFLAPLENLSAAQRARDQFRCQTDADDCRFAVSYVEAFSATDHDAYVTTLHLAPFLAAVDPRVTLTFSGLDTAAVGLVANRSGGGVNTEYGATWDHNSAVAPINSSINGAIYRGVTPGGGFSTRTTGCGGFLISTAGSQVPAPGNTIAFNLSGSAGPNVFLVGVPSPSLFLCPACALGVALSPSPVFLPGPSLNITVPCSSNLVGGTLAVQGAAVLSPGGCPGFGVLVTSDTVDVTIR